MAIRISDKEATVIIIDALAQRTTGNILEMEPCERITLLRVLKASRLSIRQISRLMGISKGLVERA